MDINANLEDLLSSLRAEKQAEAGDGVDQRNVEGTSHPSGQTEVTKDDNLMHEETGPRYSENEGDVASSYSNTPEETEQASQTEEGNLSQEPMAVTTDEKPQEDGNPKKEKDDSPTEHPAATDKAASASEKIAKAIDALDALIKKAEEEDKKEDEGAEESDENPKPEPEKTPAPEKAENDYSEGDVKEAAAKNPEAAQLGYILAANKHQEEQIKQAYEADPEGFTKGLEEGQKFAEAFQAGEKKAQEELEKVASARLGNVITRAETSAQCVGEYLTGFAHAQMKKAGIPVPPEALAAEEAVAPEAGGELEEAVDAIEGEAAPEAAAPEALAGEEAAGAPVDAAAISEAIDQALSEAEATGPASEDEIAEALAEVLTSSDVSLGDELAAEIGEEEKMAKEKAASSKLTPAIKKAAVKKIVLKRLAQKRAKSKK